MRDEILRLPVGYPIVVRSGSGNFESYILFLSEKDETAGVVGDDGSPEVVRWSQLELHPDGIKALEPVPTSSSLLCSLLLVPFAYFPRFHSGCYPGRLCECRVNARNDSYAKQ
jgi:hypothetical protein